MISLLLELGIMTSHIIWRLRTRNLHKRAKAEGINFDDLHEAIKNQRPTDQLTKKPIDDLELGDIE